MLFAFLTALALPTAHADEVQLYLNDPIGREAPLNQCIDDHCRALLKTINGAQSTIDFAVYGFRNQQQIHYNT